MSWAAPLMLAAALASQLAARSPDQRQVLVDLSFVLGEAHALRQACADSDQSWRERMSRMVALEAPDEGLRRRLIDSFNAGFAAQQAEHRACGPDTTAAEQAVAGRGRGLAERLSGGGL